MTNPKIIPKKPRMPYSFVRLERLFSVLPQPGGWLWKKIYLSNVRAAITPGLRAPAHLNSHRPSNNGDLIKSPDVSEEQFDPFWCPNIHYPFVEVFVQGMLPRLSEIQMSRACKSSKQQQEKNSALLPLLRRCAVPSYVAKVYQSRERERGTGSSTWLAWG